MSLFDDLPDPVSEVLINTRKRLPSEENTKDYAIPKKQIIGLRNVYVGLSSRKGEREEMQDAHTILNDFMPYLHWKTTDEICRAAFYAVYDGHSGLRASKFASKNLHIKLANSLPEASFAQIDKDMKRIFLNTYKKTDDDFLKLALKERPHWKDGSTASTVLLMNNTLYIAHIGDSRIVLARSRSLTYEDTEDDSSDIASDSKNDAGNKTKSSLVSLTLTRDHTPLDYEERQRIMRYRSNVLNGRINGILEVSRSFGDYQFKKHGVTCIPEFSKLELTNRDRFLLIGCDGLWKCFSPNEAVMKTYQLLVEYHILNEDNKISLNDQISIIHALDSVCSCLVNDAVMRMSGDNVTCILLLFDTENPIFQE